MFRVTTTSVRDAYDRTHGSARRVVTVVRSQPGWVTRLALAAAAITLTAILLILIVPVILITLLVFALAAGVHLVASSIRAILSGPRPGSIADTGRQNVRVIPSRRND